MMAQTKLFKSDGNGGFIIQKGTLAMIMTLIALLGCITTVVAYGVTMKSDIVFLKERSETISQLHDNVIESDKKILTNEERILSIHDDIQEIKTDLKELIRK